MPSTETVVPPVVAGVVAVALTVQRYLTALLVELQVDVSARALTRLTLGGRFVAFVLVYALLFGVAYWAGTRRSDTDSDAVLAGATFAVAAVCALVATAAVVGTLGFEARGPVFAAVTVLATSTATGVELAVVAFAGVAVGRR